MLINSLQTKTPTMSSPRYSDLNNKILTDDLKYNKIVGSLPQISSNKQSTHSSVSSCSSSSKKSDKHSYSEGQKKILLVEMKKWQQQINKLVKKWNNSQEFYKQQQKVSDTFFKDIVSYIEMLRVNHNKLLNTEREQYKQFIKRQSTFMVSYLQRVKQYSNLLSKQVSPINITEQICSCTKMIETLKNKIKQYKQKDNNITNITKQNLDNQFNKFVSLINNLFGVQFSEKSKLFNSCLSFPGVEEWSITTFPEDLNISIIQKLKEL